MRLFYLFIALLISQALLAQPDYAPKLETFMQAQVEVNHFNGNVLVAQKGQIRYQKAFGYANYDTKIPLDLNSVFELGSVSKQFTAMSILLLKEQGKLHLSDTLRQFFPQLPYHNITIQQLLTHTSGLPDHETEMDTRWDHQQVATNADMIQFLAHYKPPVHFPPGLKYEYSNTGYALLSAIVEKVSGQRWAEFTKQYIFKPLGMNRSRVYVTRRSQGEVIPDYAYGYVYLDSLQRYVLPDRVPQYDLVYYLDGIYGDGGVNSTVGDLYRWDRALKNHTLLSEATQRAMLSKQVLANAQKQTFYGYGVRLGQQDNKEIVAHGGSWPGYKNYLTRYIDDDLTIIVLSNNEAEADKLSISLGAIALGKAVALPQNRRVIPVDENLLERYVGTYEFAPENKFILIRDGNRLLVRSRYQPTFELQAETDTRFNAPKLFSHLEFIRDNRGQVTRLVEVRDNGQQSEAKKIN